MDNKETKKIVVVDCGTSYIRSLLDALADIDVFATVVPSTATYENIREILNPDAYIISGSNYSVHHKNAFKPDSAIFSQTEKLVLGVCYGMQYMVHALGGQVKVSGDREYGATKIFFNVVINNKTAHLYPDHILNTLNQPSNIGIYDHFDLSANIWMSHVCKVTRLPNGFMTTAVSENGILASIERENLVGVQFHPEKKKEDGKYTGDGELVLQNFINKII
jgi:GMP synthase (glutamine-hydrolysing)